MPTEIPTPAPCARCRAPLPLNADRTVCAACLLDVALAEPPPEPARSDWLEADDDTAATTAALTPSTRFGPYELLGELARGGMGIVYRARQRQPERTVALKIILPQQAATAGVLARFRAEAAMVASLDHPHILPIYEAGERDGLPFFSMKFADGGSLATRMADFAGQPREAAHLVAVAARAVHHAHQRGILHRDLKPGNILLHGEERTPFVTDFGIAKWLGRDSALTLTQDFLGTPAYAAPEQAYSGAADVTTAVDVYGLGAVLYELLTQRAPFTAETALETLRKVVDEPPVAPRVLVPGIPRDLETICLKCLEKDPAARYASAAALADDLERWADGRPIRARYVGAGGQLARWARRKPALAALSALLLLLLVGVSVGSTVAATRLAAARNRALGAERDALEKLHGSYLDHARASRRTGRAGQRFESLAALEKAADIRVSPEIRNEAIAALALADLAVERSWKVRATSNAPLAFDAVLARYAVETDPGVVSVRRVADAGEIARLGPAPEGAPRILFLTPFSADGRWLAARHANGLLRVWDVAGNRLAFELKDRPTGGAYPLFPLDCAFSPDSRRVAVGVPGGGVAFHDLATGAETGRIATAVPPACVSFDPSGTRLAVVGKMARTVQVFDLATGQATLALEHPGYVTPVAWSPDGRWLATGGQDFNVTLWDTRTGERHALLTGHRQPPTQLLFAHGGQWLVSTARDKTIRIWDTRSGALLVTMPAEGGEPVMRLSEDDTRLACTAWDLDASLLRVGRPEAWGQLRASTAGERAGLFAAVDFSPDGRSLLTVSRAAVRLFDASRNGGEELGALAPFDADAEKSAIFTRDGAALLVSSRITALSCVPWQREEEGNGRRAVFGPREVLDPTPTFLLNALSADGNTAALTSRSRGETHLQPWREPANQPVTVLPGQPEAWGAAFSPDGRWVVTTSSGYSASMAEVGKVWDAADGHPVHDLSTGAAGSANFSPDGRWLAVNGTAGCQLRHVGGGWEPGPALSEEVKSVSVFPTFSPDSRLLAVTMGETIHLLRADTGEPLAILEPPAPLSSARLCFRPDGSGLSALGSDGALQLWDLGALRRELGARGLDWK